jgi:hypothetical protein
MIKKNATSDCGVFIAIVFIVNDGNEI